MPLCPVAELLGRRASAPASPAAGRPRCSSSKASKNSPKWIVRQGRPGVARASTMSSQAVPAVVVPAQPVDGRRGVGAAAEVAGARPAGPLPSLAEPLGQRERLVPVARQRGRRRSAAPWPGGPPRGGTAGPGAVRPAAGRPAGRRRRWRTRRPCTNASKNSNPDSAVTGSGASSSVRRNALAAAARTSPRSQLDRGELVQRGALGQRVADAAGQLEGPLGELGGGRIGVGAVERLGGQDPGLPRPGRRRPAPAPRRAAVHLAGRAAGWP